MGLADYWPVLEMPDRMNKKKNNNNARAKKEKLTAPKVSEVHGKTLILLSFCAIQRLFCYEPVDWI